MQHKVCFDESDGKLYFVDDAGVKTLLAESGNPNASFNATIKGVSTNIKTGLPPDLVSLYKQVSFGYARSAYQLPAGPVSCVFGGVARTSEDTTEGRLELFRAREGDSIG